MPVAASAAAWSGSIPRSNPCGKRRCLSCPNARLCAVAGSEVRDARDREPALILPCARVHIPPPTLSRIRGLAAEAIDWDYLGATAEWHGVASLMLNHLRAAGAPRPAEVITRL